MTTTMINTGALLCVAAGLLAAVITVLLTGDGHNALRIALDFWAAGGLLRLGQSPGWQPLLVVVLIIGIRQLVGYALRRTPIRPADLVAHRERS